MDLNRQDIMRQNGNVRMLHINGRYYTNIGRQSHAMKILQNYASRTIQSQLMSSLVDFHVRHSVEPGKKVDSSKTHYSMKCSEYVKHSIQDTSCLKTSKALPSGQGHCTKKSTVWGSSGLMAFSMREILESLKPEKGTLQSVFKEESCLVHNIYGGFKETEVRVFSEYSPTIRTPKGGGHLPSVLKKNGELYSLTPEECEILQGFQPGWTDLNAVETPSHHQCLSS
jgi:hypothetical protein